MKNVPSVSGSIEYVSPQFIKGLIRSESSDAESIFVAVSEGNRVIEQICAGQQADSANGQGDKPKYYDFTFPIPPRYQDGRSYEFHFKLVSTGEELKKSPARICFFPEQQLIPFHTASLTGHKVLVLSPHPDDESLACGGSLILHARNRDHTKIIFLTDGSKADQTGEYGKEEYVSLREAEAKRACEILGAFDIEFWGIPDRTLSVDEPTIERLSQLLNSYEPSLIYAPSPLEFHPDHSAAAKVLWKALERTALKTEVAFYEYNRPSYINTLVDITSAVEEKKKACRAYESQHENYDYTDFAVSLNRYRAITVSPGCQYAEGYLVLNSREVLKWPLDTFMLKKAWPTYRDTTQQVPLVSVIIRTQNRPILLKDAISSVVAQTYPNLEVIVVNDGGEDVGSMIEEFTPHIRIHYATHEYPRGRSAAANTGLKAAQGKYFNLLDDDDLFYPEHIERLVGFLEATGEKFAYSDCEMGIYKFENGEFVLQKERELFMGFDFDQDRLYYGNYIPMMTAMFSRQLYEAVGLFDEGLEYLEDWDYWIRASRHSVLQHVPGKTAEYRVMSDHSYDGEMARLKVLNKYNEYWSVENLARSAWPRIHSLQAQIKNLESDNLTFQSQLSRVRDELNASRAEWDQSREELDHSREELDHSKEELKGLQAQLGKVRDELNESKAESKGLRQELNRHTSSYAWRFLNIYGKIKYPYLLPLYRLLRLMPDEGKRPGHPE